MRRWPWISCLLAVFCLQGCSSNDRPSKESTCFLTIGGVGLAYKKDCSSSKLVETDLPYPVRWKILQDEKGFMQMNLNLTKPDNLVVYQTSSRSSFEHSENWTTVHMEDISGATTSSCVRISSDLDYMMLTPDWSCPSCNAGVKEVDLWMMVITTSASMSPCSYTVPTDTAKPGSPLAETVVNV